MRLPFLLSFRGPVARGSIVSLAVHLTAIGIATVQAILMARLLGPEGYGIVAFLLSISGIFAIFATLGTERLAAHEVARLRTQDDRPGLKGFVITTRYAVVTVAVTGALLWFGLAKFSLPGWSTGPWVSLAIFVSLLFPLMTITLQTQGVLRGFGRVAASQIPHTVLRPLIVVAFLALASTLSWQVGPRSFLIAAVIGNVSSVLLALALLHHAIAPLRDSGSEPPRPSYVACSAAPFMVTGVLNILNGEINTLILTIWGDAKQTGLFQPIARIAPLLMLAMHAVGVRYGPRITELWTAGATDRLIGVTRTVTLTTTVITFLSAATLLFLADPILGLFGSEFKANSHALWWIAGAQIVNVACGPAGLLLSMSGKAGKTVLPLVIGLAVNIAVGAWLIPARGAEGAAIAMASGIVVWNVLLLLSVKRQMRMDPSLWGLLRPVI